MTRRERIARVEAKRPREPQVTVRHEPAPAATGLVEVLRELLERWRTASRLLGAAGRVMDAAGVTLQVSYTRVDERGSCYLAANWIPVEVVRGREHTTGNRTARWLPGLYDPGTEIVDRVRWERGPRAADRGADWDGEQWIVQRRPGVG